jgi:O-antigen ligase
VTPRLDWLIVVGLLAALVFTALAFGGVEPWAVGLSELLLAGLAALWVIRTIVGGRIELALPATVLPFAGLVAWVAIQGITISDASGNTKSLSLDAEATRNAATVMLFLLIFFLLSSTFLGTRERIEMLARFLIIYGAALAMFALIQSMTWNGAYYWIRQGTTHGFGPFANRDHFAGYMAMLAPLPVALLIAGAVKRDLRLLVGFAAAIMGTATVASLSRGGILSFVMGLLFTVVAAPSRPGAKRAPAVRLAAAGSILVAVVIGTLWIGAAPIVNRAAQTLKEASESEPNYYSREWLWRDTLALVRHYPITGVGAGAFETVFPAYSHASGQYIVAQSHNDYLQLLADCGIVGGALGVLFLVLLYPIVKRGLNASDRLQAGMALGCGGGIFALLVHSLFDFNLQIPSNAMLFVFLVAVVWSIARVAARAAGPGVESRALALAEPAARSAGGVSL